MNVRPSLDEVLAYDGPATHAAVSVQLLADAGCATAATGNNGGTVLMQAAYSEPAALRPAKSTPLQHNATDVAVDFEGGAGTWNEHPTNITRTEPEDGDTLPAELTQTTTRAEHASRGARRHAESLTETVTLLRDAQLGARGLRNRSHRTVTHCRQS